MTQLDTDGIVVLDKPSGATSHQVVGQLRRLLGIRKIGHAGTLDPMATGVLILGVGRATRLLGHLALHDKRYTATVRLGERSTTDDADGEVTPVADASGLTCDDVDRACAAFRGDIMQVPSAVSAIKINGRRAYALAREGKDVQLQARPVTITRLDVRAARTSGARLDVDIDVECSSGTYIRAIARDLGESLGVGGHLVALRRTRIGNYDIADATTLDEHLVMMPMAEAARRSFPVVMLDEHQTHDVRFGRSLDIQLPGEVVGLLSPGGQLLGLYGPKDGRAMPITVLVGPETEIAIR